MYVFASSSHLAKTLHCDLDLKLFWGHIIFLGQINWIKMCIRSLEGAYYRGEGKNRRLISHVPSNFLESKAGWLEQGCQPPSLFLDQLKHVCFITNIQSWIKSVMLDCVLGHPPTSSKPHLTVVLVSLLFPRQTYEVTMRALEGHGVNSKIP